MKAQTGSQSAAKAYTHTALSLHCPRVGTSLGKEAPGPLQVLAFYAAPPSTESTRLFGSCPSSPALSSLFLNSQLTPLVWLKVTSYILTPSAPPGSSWNHSHNRFQDDPRLHPCSEAETCMLTSPSARKEAHGRPGLSPAIS